MHSYVKRALVVIFTAVLFWAPAPAAGAAGEMTPTDSQWCGPAACPF